MPRNLSSPSRPYGTASLAALLPLLLATAPAAQQGPRGQPTPAVASPANAKAAVDAGATKAGAPAGRAAAARRGTLRATLEREGRLVPATATAVRLDLDAYAGELEIAELTPHGTMVNEGDILVRFTARKLDEQIEQAELELAHATRKAQIADEEARLAEAAGQAELTRAEQELAWARRRLEGYLQREKAHEKEADRLSRLGGKHRLEDEQDELQQLEKMYEEDELVDATEEIVLKRARRRYAQSQAFQALSERRSDYRFEVELALKQEAMEFDVAQKTAAFERQQRAPELRKGTRELAQERARFDLQRQKETLQRLRTDRERLTVRALHGGVLLHGELEAAPAKSSLREGGKVAAAAVLFTVAKPGAWEVVTEVPETHLFQLEPGKAAEITSAALPGLRGVGALRVDYLPSSRDGKLNLYRGRVQLDTKDARLRPGIGCNVRIVLDEVKDAVLVPKEAITGSGDQATALVAQSAEGPFEERRVKIGPGDGKDVVVEQGIAAGEVVQLGPRAAK